MLGQKPEPNKKALSIRELRVIAIPASARQSRLVALLCVMYSITYGMVFFDWLLPLMNREASSSAQSKIH
jgi:hypothetical protein